MEDDSTRAMARVLTAVAELALLRLGRVAWVTGRDATRFREHFELLCELLEECNDIIDKRSEE